MSVDEPPYEITPLFLLKRERLSELLAGLNPGWYSGVRCDGRDAAPALLAAQSHDHEGFWCNNA